MSTFCSWNGQGKPCMETLIRSKQAELPTKVPPCNATPPNHRDAKQHAEAQQTQSSSWLGVMGELVCHEDVQRNHEGRNLSVEHKTEAIRRSSKGGVGTESNKTSHALAWQGHQCDKAGAKRRGRCLPLLERRVKPYLNKKTHATCRAGLK